MALYTQTVEQLKRDVARSVGGLVYNGTADSGSSSTIVHDELRRFTSDDALNGKEVDCVGGVNAGEELQISDFTASSGTITVIPNFTTTPTSTTRYHVYNPAIVTARLLEELIAEAVRALGRFRLVTVTSRKLILNDLLNGEGDMETWTVSTIPDSWAHGSAGTWTQQTAANDANKVRFGSSSAKVVSDGTNAADIYYAIEPHLRYDGDTVTAKGWVWTATASRVRISLIDGVAQVNSSYHSGGSNWEELTAKKTLADPIRLRPQLFTVAGGAVTSYYDHVRVIDEKDIWEYTLPSAFAAISEIYVEGSVEEQFRPLVLPPHLYEVDRTNSNLIIDRSKFSGYGDRRLHIKGLGPLTAPSADDSTVEVPEYVKAYCRYHILANLKGTPVEVLGFAKRRLDEEESKARRLPSAKNLKWIER